MFQGSIFVVDALIVTIDNKVYTVPNNHPNVDRLHQAFKDGDVKEFLNAYDIRKAVEEFVDGGETKDSGVTIVGDTVMYCGKPVDNAIVDAIQRMMRQGFDIGPIVKFLENMMKCPSYNSVQEMWKFICKMGLTVTEDGCFLAYKSVRSNYRDKYSGTIDNTPGKKPERMERSEVDDNSKNHCSNGYHVGALGYAGPGGWYNHPSDKVLICKINPADVVSVPNDHSCQKLRCCYYEPVGEFQGELTAAVYTGKVGGDYSSYPETEVVIQDSFIDADDLLEGNLYVANYTKRNGETSMRHFLVVEEQYENYIVELVSPEQNSGEYRTFMIDGLSNVKSLNDNYDAEDDNIYW